MQNTPDFFENRTEPWRFEDVLFFIQKYFQINEEFSYRVGDKINKAGENTRAGIVLAYAQLMDYTFSQVKALFSEHDHFAIAVPGSREGRNILEINRIYFSLVGQGHDQHIKINDFPEYFEIPENILTLKNNLRS